MNSHVHPVMREVLRAFANTQPQIDAATITDESSADLREELIREWRADDRESAEEERRESER